MNRKQQLSIFLIFAVSMIIYCVAASPDALVNTNLEPEYWIHLDPVSDKQVKDSFVITGTTNLPAGENVTIGIRNLLFQRGIRNLSPEWFREDVVTIVNGTGENNMFTTPIITPMEDIKDPKFYATYPDGEKMPVWLASEYMVRVEYSGNASVKSAVALFDIFPDNLSEQITPIPVMIIATPLHMPPPPTQTSLPGLLPLGSLGIIGCFVRLMRK